MYIKKKIEYVTILIYISVFLKIMRSYYLWFTENYNLLDKSRKEPYHENFN